jgi:hypothetical protein
VFDEKFDAFLDCKGALIINLKHAYIIEIVLIAALSCNHLQIDDFWLDVFG